MRIAYVGNFNQLSVGEPEIAKCLETLGHQVIRYQEGCDIKTIDTKCDLLLFAKFRCGSVKDREEFMEKCRAPQVCWIFDLYWGLSSDNEL